MVSSNDKIRYYTTVGGFAVYKDNEADLSKLKDCIILKNTCSPNVMIIDHVPVTDDFAGWRAISTNTYNAAFKLISDGNPCTACKNAYDCMFKDNIMVSDCINACGSLLRRQDPPSGFKYIKSGYTVDPFCPANLQTISLCKNLIDIRTKEVCEAAARGRYTRKFRKKHCINCVYNCTCVPRKTNGKSSNGKCKLTQETLYSVLDEEVKLRFGSYKALMSMSTNCGSILLIDRHKHVVACPLNSKYYLLRKISKPFTLKLLESKHLSTKTTTCSKRDVAKLRTMIAYQNSVNMFLGHSNDWRVFYGGYILPMAFTDMDDKESNLSVYCKQPSMRGRESYYRNPEEVIQVQCNGENWGLNILYPFTSSKSHIWTPSDAVRKTKDFLKNPDKYLQIWNCHLNKYKTLEIINNPKIKQGGKLQW